jgi:hypothetical protein
MAIEQISYMGRHGSPKIQMSKFFFLKQVAMEM